ncbi:MAG TPA: excinuclease ABC subunit UvrA [Acidobacteriota bacterium]|jgi:excinuclease ABC subunit A|nr:excinuclease ABC subunit UvrA [Acidobacteriota bacterium]
MIERIAIRGARQHNLKNIDLEIPREKLTVITGLSGSGKSSLAFDTIYAEGQRRYIESLSTYARQFLEQMEKPDVDSIEGLSPAISIEQKTTTRSPRSTVGTITEIYDYLRLLFSSVGTPHCPNCGKRIARQSVDQIVESILTLPPNSRVVIYAPVVRARKGEFKKQLERYLKLGYLKARIDGAVRNLEDEVSLDKRKNHTIEVVVDRLMVNREVRKRLQASVQSAINLAEGLVLLSIIDGEEILYSEKMACVDCGISVATLEPRSFSFNSKFGACPECEGLGRQMALSPEQIFPDLQQPIESIEVSLDDRDAVYFLRESLNAIARRHKIPVSTQFHLLPAKVIKEFLDGSPEPLTYFYGDYRYKSDFRGASHWLMDRFRDEVSEKKVQDLERLFKWVTCPACGGSRLKKESISVKVNGRSIHHYVSLPVDRALEAFRQIQLTGRDEQIAGSILKEIRDRLQFLLNVGLSYLSLDRPASSLSGGEGQRIRLAAQIGSKMRGVLYVLDEPSIGLHPRDNSQLIETLRELQQLGNTIIVVEHDEETIRSADYIVDLGPGAGSQGGEVVVAGNLQDIISQSNSLTGKYLSGQLEVTVSRTPKIFDRQQLVLRGVRHHNLKNLVVGFPLSCFISVTGVSGSGKSSLVDEVLYRALSRKLYRSVAEPGEYDSLEGLEHIDKVIEIDQSPLGRTPRSNPATYTGLFTSIRELFAMLPESRLRGYKPGRFSFNVKGGRCETCQGDGLLKIEMNFLPDVYVTCEACGGMRYNRETLSIKYKGYSISDVLNLTAQDALPVLENIPTIRQKLQTLVDVGLGYVKLGQSATTLSGGEAQRVKLAKELSRRATGRTLYILDEPTTGLHFDDIKKLLDILHSLVNLGNTVIIIEHNLDVIRASDWIIDLGPEGGDRGGYIVVEGPPEKVLGCSRSYTGAALRQAVKNMAANKRG